MPRAILGFTLVLGAVASDSVFARTIRVDRAGSGDFTDIQAAIDAAENGDTVVVAPGEYTISEPINFNRSRDPESGGRSVKNLVVRSERGAEKTVLRLAASPVDPFRASVVVFENGESADSVLEGFSLTGGTGTSLFGHRRGGGIYCRSNASPHVKSCILLANDAQLGGGVYCGDLSSPVLTDCMFSGNTADVGGGLFSASNSAPVALNCVFTRNAAKSGGAVYCGDTSKTKLRNCLVTGNGAVGDGAVGDVGGVRCDTFARPELGNCTIAGNAGFGVVITRTAFASLKNCIVWGNLAGSIVGKRNLRYCCVEGGEAFDGNGDEGNIRRDPLFVEPGWWDDRGTPDDEGDDVWREGDYHLRADSPCIDAGHPDGAPETDLVGNGRPCGGELEIGAYEFCRPADPLFRRGDTNADGDRNLSDPLVILSYLFKGGGGPPCLDAADSDDTGDVNLADSIYLLSYLFSAGEPPVRPFGVCGVDSTEDGLTCESFAACP